MHSITIALAALALIGQPGNPAADAVFFQAHRGGLLEVPENTLAALDHAWAIPGAVPEIDLRTTSDNVIVCMHDETPKRTTNAPPPWADANLREIPLEQVRQWDAGAHFGAAYAGEKVPTLDEVFDRMKGRPERQVYLDIKDVDLDALPAKIRGYALDRQVIFVHGDPEMCGKLQALYPGARTMTWISGTPTAIRARYGELARGGFAGISQLQFHLRARRAQPPFAYVLDDDFLREAVRATRAAGVELQLRPFQFDAASLRRLMDLGVRWYVTDEPRAFAAAVEAARRLDAAP